MGVIVSEGDLRFLTDVHFSDLDVRCNRCAHIYVFFFLLFLHECTLRTILR